MVQFASSNEDQEETVLIFLHRNCLHTINGVLNLDPQWKPSFRPV